MQPKGTKYDNFRKWMRLNGCKVDDSVLIPSIINSCIGASATKHIPANRAIISIPEKLIISAQKVYQQPELNNLFEDNDDLFDYEACDEHQFNILAVFLMYEKGKTITGPRKGQQQEFYSFWQPYFQSVSECVSALDWSQEDYGDLSHQIKEQIVFFQIEMAMLKIRMVQYLEKRSEFQGLTTVELSGLFDWAYRFVMTRCFGECTSTTCLIPVVDMINHANHNADHNLLNMGLENQQEILESNYKKYTGKVDLSLLAGSSAISVSNPCLDYITQEGGLSRQCIDLLSRQEKAAAVNLINQSKLDSKEIYQLQFYSSSDSEDNDTESDGEQESHMEMTLLKQQESQQMQQFKEEYRSFKLITYAQSKFEGGPQVPPNTNGLVVQKQLQEGLTEQKQIPSNQPRTTQTNLTGQTIEANQGTEDWSQQSAQLVYPFQSRHSQSSSSEESRTPQWYSSPGTYFTVHTVKHVKPNQEIFISYGSRTNKFLLIWYGFTYTNNKYDSVAFRLNVDFDNQADPGKLLFHHYYLEAWKDKDTPNPYQRTSKEFRLKRGRIDPNLIVFLRVFLMNQYKGRDQAKLMGTQPASVEFEVFVFEYMNLLLEALMSKYPLVKIQEWRSQESASVNCRFKRVFYEQQRSILDSNVNLVTTILRLLRGLQKDHSANLKDLYAGATFASLRGTRAYIQLLQDNLDYIRHEPQ